jgi:hypothetical protein
MNKNCQWLIISFILDFFAFSERNKFEYFLESYWFEKENNFREDIVKTIITFFKNKIKIKNFRFNIRF